MGNRLFTNLAAGRRSLGVCVSIPGSEIVDCYGAADWDVFYANMHASRIDWGDLALMNLAARSWDITPCARIPMQAWVGPHNPALTTDAHRAFALGSDVVMVSVHGGSETRDLAELTTIEQERLGRELMVIPAIETPAALDQLDDILAVDGLQAAFLGVADLSRAIGADDIDDPRMLSVIASFIERAHDRGVAPAVNTGYTGGGPAAWDTSIRRSHLLYDLGAELVFSEPTTEFLVGQLTSFIGGVRRHSEGIPLQRSL